jgi:hypothetical protein
LYNNIDSSSETKNPFQTAGATSNTNNQAVNIGSNATPGNYFGGAISLIVWTNNTLTDNQTASIQSSLKSLEVGTMNSNFLSWGSTALTGPYTVAPNETNYNVVVPNGNTPTEADLDSYRYHHNTEIAVDNGRVWVAFSGSGTNEEAGGEIVGLSSSNDNGNTWSDIQLAVPPQSTFSGTGASLVIGTRSADPRGFVNYNGGLYIVSTIDTTLTTGQDNPQGLALVANKCNSDGTLGPVFRITSDTYTPINGKTAIAYDATLGPPLLTVSEIFGKRGGSAPGNPLTSWRGWLQYNNSVFSEPTTIPLTGSNNSLVRLWRGFSGSLDETKLWSQTSSDGGSTWSILEKTSIPNEPSNTNGIRLPDGRIVLVGNPVDVSVVRDPLYVAIFNGTTGVINNIYAVRQGLSGTPVYSGTYKGGGAQYPGISFDGTNLWISYSIAKESIGVTKIPLSGL